MSGKFPLVCIKKEFINTISEALDGETQEDKERPYYVEIDIFKNYKVFLPLRSNCGDHDYYVNIYNDSPQKRKNPGIDCSKMIIVKENNVQSIMNTIHKPINNDVYNDIYSKKAIIKDKCLKTICTYKTILQKKKTGLLLSENETYLYNFSTLCNYKDMINNLEQSINK